MPLTLNNLTQYHQAVIEGIKAALPNLATVAAYNPAEEQKLNTPAVLLELTQMEPAEAISGGRIAVNLAMAAHVFLAKNDVEDIQLSIRNLAAWVLQAVHRNNWGLGGAVGNPKTVEAFPGSFNPDCDGYESWLVSWEQTIYLGAEDQPPEWLPGEIVLGVGYG
ncbi:hypothetical protein [Spartinivicinus poritis]|uniref:Uncharacterized protein n=1 Tax=Spartinivicinus poritis TaxID=2994640 RepID=A0ABT5UHP8_9GAMM|nr:hypothetical protein [Spartinivicinus sp. A2-2]MDE1465925.1 hypothetical protein [Spartinivicinus sp. A2-2]